MLWMPETLARYRITADKQYIHEEFAEIYAFNEKLLAREYLLTLLSRYRKSQAEAVKKLKSKGYSATATREAIKFAKEYRYLDDTLYAQDYVKENEGKKGIYKIKHTLLAKGIKKDVAEEALLGLDTQSQLAAACKLCVKAAKGEEIGYKLKQKLYSRLMQAGFASDVIAKALKSYNLFEYGDVPEYDED